MQEPDKNICKHTLADPTIKKNHLAMNLVLAL